MRSALATFLLLNSSVLGQSDFTATSCGLTQALATSSSFLRRRLLLRLGSLSLLAHHLLVELLARTREHLFDILAGLSRCLEALVNAILASKLHSTVEVDLSGALKFTLVTNKVDANIFSSVLLDLLQPASQVFKSLVASDIVSEEHAVGAPVKDPCHRFERLLSRLTQLSYKDRQSELQASNSGRNNLVRKPLRTLLDARSKVRYCTSILTVSQIWSLIIFSSILSP